MNLHISTADANLLCEARASGMACIIIRRRSGGAVM
jgi:hypothetical protein